METVVAIFGLIILVIIIMLITRSMDSDRIKNEIESNGGTLISKDWAPFGQGWIGEGIDTIYEVIYLDKDGNKHFAYVKTSFLSGVYFSSDTIVEYKNPKPNLSNYDNDLKNENEKLKQEIEELKKGMGS